MSRRGLTLLEVLIAMFVLAVGLVSVLAMFFTSSHLSRTAYNQNVASYLALDAADRIRKAHLNENGSLKTTPDGATYEIKFEGFGGSGDFLCRYVLRPHPEDKPSQEDYPWEKLYICTMWFYRKERFVGEGAQPYQVGPPLTFYLAEGKAD